MQNTYGIIDSNGCHVDVSNSLLGAKQYATKNGYDKVSIRYNCGYVATILFEKINSKWIELIKLKKLN